VSYFQIGCSIFNPREDILTKPFHIEPCGGHSEF